jgi:hypothetical protein
MRTIMRILLCAILLISIKSSPMTALAQVIPEASQPMMDCEGTIAAWVLDGYYRSGDCYCKNGRPVCGKPPSGGRSPGKKHNFNQEVKMMVVGTIFQSLLTSLFMDDAANQAEALAARQKAAELAWQQAEQKRAQEAKAQAEFEKMMQSYKQLDGFQKVGFKTLSNSDPAFKTLDGDMEALAAGARKPFDAPPELKALGSATPFFGDSMPIEDIRLLVNPENDPNVVDLRNAKTYVVENLKKDNPTPAAAEKPDAQKDKAETRPLDCVNLSKKLEGFIHQRNQFQKTIDLAQEQLTSWQNANRNALLNAAKDGLEYFTGQLLEGLAKRGEAADRLQRIYEKNAKQMVQEGLNATEIEAKIKRLKALSSAARISELAGNISDWQSFIKDGVSGLMVQLTSSNQEIQQMLEDPKMQKYFETEAPELKALLDISKIAASNKVFGKWVAKKVPIIGGVELAINQSYNALDWFLSYKRIAEAHKVNGRVMESARYLQENIDGTSLALRECR